MPLIPSPFFYPINFFLFSCPYFSFLRMRKCESMVMDVLNEGKGIQREHSPPARIGYICVDGVYSLPSKS